MPVFHHQRHRGSPSTDNTNPYMTLVNAHAGFQHTQPTTTNGFGRSPHTQPGSIPRDGKHGSGFPAPRSLSLLGERDSCTFQPHEPSVLHRPVQSSAQRQSVQPPAPHQPVHPMDLKRYQKRETERALALAMAMETQRNGSKLSYPYGQHSGY
jgi:hypothetical protein